MARTEIPITTVAETGTAKPSAVTGDSGNDHYINGGSDLLIEMTNTSGGALIATVVTSYTTAGGLALADNEVSCTAAQTKYVIISGRSNRTYYEQTGDSNRIYINVGANDWEFRAYEI